MSDDRTGDRSLSRASLARLSVVVEATELSDAARALADTTADAWARPGELVESAARLVDQARALLAYAVVRERLAGASWETIGWGLGDISKQAAAERYVAAEKDFRRRAVLAWLCPDVSTDYLGHAVGVDQAAGVDLLTAWWHDHRPPAEPEKTDPVGAGLTPMTDAEEAALLAEAAALLSDPVHRPADPHRCRQMEIGLARRKAGLYERLSAADPGNLDLQETLAGARARLAELTAPAPLPEG